MLGPSTHESGPLGPWPCIGRAQIVARILTALNRQGSARSGAVIVRASLGGGKTRCLDEVADRLSAKGRTVRRISATSATTMVPFGAVAVFLPAGARESGDPVAVIGALRDELVPHGGQRLVVMIDDVPLLDLATAGVIASLSSSGLIDVVSSARIGEPLPDPLIDVLLGDRGLAIELPPMSEDDIDTLLHLVLGGPVDGAVMLSLGGRSEGNPLFLRELTRSALESGALVESGGVWRLRREPPGSARLRDVVESRLDVVDTQSRKALELLALCDLVDLDEVESLVGLEALADLESEGLLRMVISGGRAHAAIGHPLHGESIRMNLPALRSRLLLRNHVEWVEANTAPDAVDALQLAIWRLDAGLPADRTSLLDGAKLAAALQDSKSALRLAEPLFELEPTADTGLLVADAMYQTGRWAEAMAVIQRASALPGSSHVRADLCVVQANILLWGLGDADAALASVAALRADPQMTDEDRDRLRAEYASVLVNAGRPGEALAELHTAATGTRTQIRLGAVVSYSIALAMSGRTAQALEIIDDAIASRPAHRVLGVADTDTYFVSRAYAMIEAGRLGEALTIAEENYERAVTNARPLTQFWFALLLAKVNLCQGAAAVALKHFVVARALALDVGLGGPTRSAVIGVAVCQALLGESEAADASLAEIDTYPPFRFMFPEHTLASGWAAVARGDLTAARSELAIGAAEAVETGHITSAIWILHDIARLGRPKDVLDEIARLAALTDSDFAAARLDHVLAMIDGRAQRLARVADLFESIGANLLAAEAAIAATDSARRAGDQRLATALTVRAERYLGLCTGVTTPGLTTASASVDPLTEREREIAFMAAGGLTSREIAEKLFVSQRTVGNHLQHIYDKLGVRGRAELGQVLR